MSTPDARAPFQFSTRFNLTESTGLRAANLGELLALIKEVPGSSIYHHTHRSLQQHEYLSPEPPNDFAYWITDVLGDAELGERVASIDIIQFETIRGLRDRIVETIEAHSAAHPEVSRAFARPGREFYFLSSVSFIAPTPYLAHTLQEFSSMLAQVTLDSVYFHIFEARLRLGNTENDFSRWIASSIGDEAMAAAINRLDPYTFALEDLRRKVILIVNGKEAV